MTSGWPLLLSLDNSPVSEQPLPHHSGSFSALGVSRRDCSFNTSILHLAQGEPFEVDCSEKDEGRAHFFGDTRFRSVNPVGESFDLVVNTKRLYSLKSEFFEEVPLECPKQRSKHLVWWGATASEMLHNNNNTTFSTGFEISRDCGNLGKPKGRSRRRSVQFDDVLREEDARFIYINDPRRTNDQYEFTGNEIRTSKYTLITFLPKNIFIQFHRVAYLYFLAIAALNQLPPLAVFGRTVSLFPLLFVLCVTAIKDGYEDWRRHRSDRNENNREALVLQCGLIRCEQPNRNIYEFTANMEFNGQKFSLSQSNIVLRGCQLKNTGWIIGVVVYAGQETKAMLNSAASPSKRSKLEIYMNRETLWLSIFLFIMCLVVAVGMGLWLARYEDQLDYLPYYRKRYFTPGKDYGKRYKFYGIPMEIFFSFLSSIIVFQIMIPISLYITMELVRIGQSYFMIGDRHMFDSSSGSRFQCRSLNINEDLGQIRYVFSDKTGTLTENKMEFRRAIVNGKNYGGSLLTAEQLLEENITAATTQKRWKLKSTITVDSELLKLLHKDLVGDERIVAHEFFLALAACNTVIPVRTHDGFSSCTDSQIFEDVETIDYQGESPDEQALVAAASAYGYTLFERTSGHIVIDVNGETLRLGVLGMHEFDSVRKRMSVVIRYPNDAVKVLVKGADSSVLSILAKDSGKDDHARRSATYSHLTEYSSQGLRTLVIAARDLTEEELELWQCRFDDASTSLTDRAARLRQTAALIECDLNLLGATAIEDKLQEGVPEAIESLRQAGIKVWVLTGDKQETAMSIGLSCKLLTPDMEQIIINGNSENDCRKLLSDAKAKCGLNLSNKGSQYLKCNAEMDYLQRPERKEEVPLALIIDGNSLVYILEKELESELFDIATYCKVVLCCRVAPLQKAGIVDLIKSRSDDMTLAIGDGANDVSMIQMADVGVGICGQEGRQAVMASDFAMGQFRFLKRLLLVHGHWNYQRIGYLILYNFYRNAVFVLMLFWYILFTAFSTTSALTDWSSVLYSVIYTSVPTIVVGILDKDLSHRTLLQYPKLYGVGYRHEAYNIRLFWVMMADTLWQSLVLFGIPIFIYKESTIDIWSIGNLWTVAVVILVNIHLAMDVQRWVSITHLAVWGSVIVAFACVVVLDSIPIFPNYGTIYHLTKLPTYWLTIFLIIVSALLPRFLLKLVHHHFWPSDIQIAREAEILGRGPDYWGSKPVGSSS
ncbi:hypothetical protein H0E87_012901 [Populus deltoides]|uniref:Phospholipid-transporting ATPase n=1 Tax=Populus deltoides TaxID=3696 RepID=A0A8T2YL30_POPDE|nr:hypothetical protein H0E87_012901 [Populus deltoides]